MSTFLHVLTCFIVPICQFMGTHSYESSQIYNFELDVDNAVLSLYSLSE